MPRRADSGAPEPAAVSAGIQKLIDDVKQLGRWPKRTKTVTTSEEQRSENQLYRRLCHFQSSIPADVWEELQALGGASQPAQGLVDAVEQLGFLPKRT